MAGCTGGGNIKVGKPKWLKRSLPTGPEYEKIRQLMSRSNLHTVCQEAQCPNQFECYSEGTATFMILGDRCTRNCHFCAVDHNPVSPPDQDEPERVAEAVEILALRYAVVTSVTRDDLPDGGAGIFAHTVQQIRRKKPETLIELLIPDLQGDHDGLKTIIESGPDVLNHNVETVPRLYSRVRPEAIYERSVQLIGMAKQIKADQVTKSGVMLGLGESHEELYRVWDDLLEANCDILTLGQYLQPSKKHLEVDRFVPPEEFEELKEKAVSHGFVGVASGPFVRSSYHAERLYRSVKR